MTGKEEKPVINVVGNFCFFC